MVAALRRVAGIMVFPFLAAVYPIVALYAINLREMVPLDSLLVPILVALLATALVMGVLRIAYGDWQRAGALTLVLVVMFFTYGAAWAAVGGGLPGEHITLLMVWGVLAVLASLLVRTVGARRLRSVTPLLNLVLAVLLVGNGGAIARFQLGLQADAQLSRADAPGPGRTSVGEEGERLPDIYWLILDRYGSEDVVREYYGHDISPFLEQLGDRGFYVAEHATANYLKTANNVVAARNMEYLDSEALRDRATASDDWSPLYRDMTGSFEVLEVLRPLGYRFVYLGSHWEFTESHPKADINYVFSGDRDELEGVLGNNSLLRATEIFGDSGPLGWHEEFWLRTHYQWDSLHDTIRLGRPKFVHAHIGLPHDPYVFEADGTWVPQDVAASRSRGENYANNVEFANASVLELVDALLAAAPDNPPIIIVQSEEGPYPERYKASQALRWLDEATDAELHEKFGILSAFYLPGLPGNRAEEAGLYPSITLVNEFRVILNHYFGTDYELLPDRNFVWPEHTDIYDLVDVTERVRRLVIASD